MLIGFFFTLRAVGLKVSVREFLGLLEALKANLIEPSTDEFYQLARLILVKDESHFDKFDQAFSAYLKGQTLEGLDPSTIPEDWLRKHLERVLTPEERAALSALEWNELMNTLRQRLAEQDERHEGGNRWIGTGGTSPFGAFGDNPRGIRIGQDKGRKGSAVKVWDKRVYKDYDDQRELNTRNIKVALRRLRRFAREGEATEFNMDGTIRATAANAGWLDVKWVPERHNRVKVLLLMDVGGSMDEHVHRVEELFSAARAEFKHLHCFYFHNCVYDFVWRHNHRRHTERIGTWDLMHTYAKDTKLVLVGDATMSPYELTHPGGSVEYNNAEPGAVWLQRLTSHFASHCWINPEPQGVWDYRPSVGMVQSIVGPQRMNPMTLAGLDAAMRALSR